MPDQDAGRGARTEVMGASGGRDEAKDRSVGSAQEGGGGRPAYVPDVKVDDYDYDLPAARIAVRPTEPRDASRLLVCSPGPDGEAWEKKDRTFRDAPQEIPEGALLVLNNSKVVAARLPAYKKASGGKAEVMLIGPEHPSADPAIALGAASGGSVWSAMVRGRNIKAGDVLVCESEGTAAAGRVRIVLEALVEAKNGADASVRLSWHSLSSDAATPQDLRLCDVLEEVGRVPLPPYMKREADTRDLESYQTPHALHQGSVAAPTAGLHFSREVVAAMRARGVVECHLTLHVGAGTFRPMDVTSAADHDMHSEWLCVSHDSLCLLREAVATRRPVVPVGTTSVRTLESLYWWGVKLLAGEEEDACHLRVHQWDPYRLTHACGGPHCLPAVSEALDAVIEWTQKRATEDMDDVMQVVGQTQLLIVPGYKFALCDFLFTNTHQPRSTLLMLVSALVGGHGRIHEIYRHALDRDYRFLSYGDSNFLACHRDASLRRLPQD
eukprot:Tamp_11955.p1 GENE.Tamp_11955~~Tamp_11955.p1  ORF type:complete len:552 (+),score=60.62 Tamp_11955:170-1657(+)